MLEIKTDKFIFHFLATLTACRSSQARDQTQATAVTQAAPVTRPDPSALPQENSKSDKFLKYPLNFFKSSKSKSIAC